MAYGSRLTKLALLAAAVPALMAAEAPRPETLFLGSHNIERAATGIGAMHWSPKLAADAQQWADELAAAGAFEHFEEFTDDPDAQGENLWMGTRDAFAPEEMVGEWIGEKKDFVPGVFPDNSRTGDLADVGHYTQVVWRDSGSMGCAIAKDAEFDYLVCRYARTGNIEGERPF